MGNECYNKAQVLGPSTSIAGTSARPGNASAASTRTPEATRAMSCGEAGKNAVARSTPMGTLGGQFKRKNTKQTAWPEGKAVASAWEAAGRWQDERAAPPGPSQPAPEPLTSTPEGVTIERAAAAFLGEHAESSAPNTQRNYGFLVKKFKAYSVEKGYVMLDQWGPIDVREFRQSWQVSPVTAAKNMSTVKAFFEFAVSNEWIVRNPARLVKNPRGRAGADSRSKERLPFSDEELKQMFEA